MLAACLLRRQRGASCCCDGGCVCTLMTAPVLKLVRCEATGTRKEQHRSSLAQAGQLAFSYCAALSGPLKSTSDAHGM